MVNHCIHYREPLTDIHSTSLSKIESQSYYKKKIKVHIFSLHLKCDTICMALQYVVKKYLEPVNFPKTRW